MALPSSLLELLSSGLLDLSALGLVLTTLALTHITVVAVTVYLHRFSAHRALNLHPALQHFFRFWLWLATGMQTRQWTAVHRKHHAFCESADDPHSPQVQGLSEILWRQTEAYQKSAADPDVLAQFGHGTPDDWLEKNLYCRFGYLGISLMLLLDVLLFGVVGITIWAIQMAWIPMLGGIINGIGHYWGYRNFECDDAARNIVPWGLLIGGEELHNNHHTYANSAKLSAKAWEIDLGWGWICLFRWLGLASDTRTGPLIARQPGNREVDQQTAAALANDRFNVMARYADRVIRPTVQACKASAIGEHRRLLRRAQKILRRQHRWLDERSQRRLQHLLKVPELRVVYDLRMKLQQIWEQRTGDLDELAQSIRQWCADAEATRCDALAEFVLELKSYTLPQAHRT